MKLTASSLLLDGLESVGNEFMNSDFARRKKIFEEFNGTRKPVEIEVETQESEEVVRLKKQIGSDFDDFNDSAFDTKKLSFAIDLEDLRRISNELLKISKNADSLKYLHDLDSELKGELERQKVIFPVDCKPQYLIAGNSVFILGPALEGYKSIKKNDILDSLLLKREKASGVNKEGMTPRFVGFVKKDLADDFVARGNIFSEDEQLGMLLHGKYSHRLFLEILRQAQKAGELDLKLKSGETLTHSQLLELLVKTETQRNPVKIARNKSLIDGALESFYTKQFAKRSLWLAIFDTVEDAVEHPYFGNSRFAAFNPENYSFSLRSPFVFKSLLTCFGDDFGLPNLCKYLKDSNWKQVEKMTTRILENFGFDPCNPENKRKAYDFAACVMTTATENPGVLIEKLFPVTASEQEVEKKYGKSDSGIAFKPIKSVKLELMKSGNDLPKSRL